MLKLSLTVLSLFSLLASEIEAAPRLVSVPRSMKALARLFPDHQGAMPLSVYSTDFQQLPSILRDYTRARLDEEGRNPDEELDNFQFVYDVKEFKLGYEVVGTLNKQAAFREVIDAVKNLYDGQVPVSESLRLQQRARDLMIDLKDADVVFGFDAGRSNDCNRFTTFMIFVDRQSQKIYGVDLNPCRSN